MDVAVLAGSVSTALFVVSLPLGPIWFLHSFSVIATLLMLVWHVRHAAS